MNKTTKRREKGEIEIVKKTWILLGKIFGLVLLLDLVIELLSRKSLMGLFHYGIGNFPVFLANALLLLPPFLLILFTRRKVFTAGILVIIGLVMGLINGVLLVFRTTPFTASDLRLVKYAISLLNTYLTWWQIVLGAVGIVLALILGVLLWRLAPVDSKPICLRNSLCVAGVALLVSWGGLHLAILSGILEISVRLIRIMVLSTVFLTRSSTRESRDRVITIRRPSHRLRKKTLRRLSLRQGRPTL